EKTHFQYCPPHLRKIPNMSNIKISTLLLCFAALVLSVVVNAGPYKKPEVTLPTEIITQIISANAKLKFELSAEGTQEYLCNTSATPSWTLVGPNATLISTGKKFKKAIPQNFQAKHYFQSTADAKGGKATWETVIPTTDKSFVVGKVDVSVPSPEDAKNNLAWLLLEATSNSTSIGIFSDITFVVRSKTVGGVLDPLKCTAENNLKTSK
ncbi:18509_t:CDS:2, partial [Acaulospora morrowiae]